MKHTMKVADLGRLRFSEALMSCADAERELAAAAHVYHTATTTESRGEAATRLRKAARTYSLWFDAVAHCKAREGLTFDAPKKAGGS